MFKVGEKFVHLECGQEVEYEIVRIDNEDAEYPYECFSVDTLKDADEIAKATKTTRDDVLYYGDYDFLDERSCFSEEDISRCKYKAVKLDVEFYKNALESLIDAVSERLVESYEDKIWIFKNSGISSETFKKLGYDNIACQLEDAEE